MSSRLQGDTNGDLMMDCERSAAYAYPMVRRFLVLVFPTICGGAEIPSGQLEFFESKIRPVLVQDCYECHRTGGKKKGGLALDHRAAMVEGGDSEDLFDFDHPEQSYLIRVLRHQEKGMEMPKDGVKLDDRVIADFVKWIGMGAPDPRDQPPSNEELEEEMSWEQVRERRKGWWSFQPVRKITPPPGEGTVIDRFIDRQIKGAGLTAADPADDRILIRRLSFALRGLPPSIEEVNRFLADRASGRWSRLVDRFLASPDFGERWARHWMDWIRYADSHGSEGDPLIPNAWRYRDYLIRALNDNVPYDLLVREHLAGDLLDEPRLKDGINESALGTAHLRMVYHGFAPTDALDEKVRFTDDQINVVTKAFQGLTVSCARCHHHKFDAISQEDYYALFGIFGSTKPGVVRVDAVDEEALRSDMEKMKERLWHAKLTEWQAMIPALTERFLNREVKGPVGEDLLFLRVWQEGSNDFSSFLKQLAPAGPEGFRFQWRGEALGGWKTHGEVRKASRAIAVEGDGVISGIHPPGLSSRELSSKDRGILLSPQIEVEGEDELWLRVRGGGNAVVRYAVQNYPRNGTVFPFTQLKDGKWRWIRHDLDYWKGDRIHLEITTARDQAVLAGNDERSWFEIAEAAIVKRGQGSPADVAREGMKSHLQSLHREGDSNKEFFERLLGDALAAARQDRLSEQQAVLLDDLLQTGVLPNLAAGQGELVATYRTLEHQLAVPLRAPGVWEADPHDQEFFERGNHKKPGDPVKRRYLEVLGSAPYESKLSGRLELADDFLRPDNPFTARVIVNRVWHHLFGTGIVRTVDNFGRLGEPPSHPDLLDHLASEFVADGWNLKNLIRKLVTTRAWTRASVPGPGAREKDPDNRLLSHYPLRRLEAEAIRDSLLRVSGGLDETRYGRGVEGRSLRRSVYLSTIRNRLDPFLQTFNAPVPLGGTGRREETNVPAQSLLLLNSDWVADLATKWGNGLTGESREDIVRNAYETAFSRPPTPAERDGALAFMTLMESERKEGQSRREEVGRLIEEELAEIARLEAVGRAGLNLEIQVPRDRPQPLAVWDFEGNARDRVGALHGKLHGGATIVGGRLRVGPEQGYFTSAPLDRDLGEKTLQVLLQLEDLQQRGGGALGVQTLDGHTFDSIVFAEKDQGQWLAGSEYFRRTQGVGGSPEITANGEPVWITITYRKDGQIEIYRNAAPYGKPYRKGPLPLFKKGQAQVIVGNRHGEPAVSRLLHGWINEARVFDRALSPDEVGRSIGMKVPPSREEIRKNLTLAQRAALEKAESRLVDLRARQKELARVAPPSSPFVDLVHALFNSKEFIYVR